MTTDPQGPRRRRGLPGMPLLGRGGLVLGVAILFAIVILGGNVLGGDDSRVNAIADPLDDLPAFPTGTLPPDAPATDPNPAPFAMWAMQRAYGDWERAFGEAGRAWQAPTAPGLLVSSVPAEDAQATQVLNAGFNAAGYVQNILGIPGRIELARRDNPDSQRELQDQQQAMLSCLAGAWGRTLMTPARLAAAAPAPRAESVRLGAEIGDPSVCDTFSTDGG